MIVAHDGATWLPHVIDALLAQTRPVQRVVAVDTGSRDRSGSVLAGLLGQSVVFGMDRGTGYAAAVARAVQHRAANVNVPSPAGVPDGERVEWLWLLHDDSEPAPDALEQLLRGATETRSAAVLGPKVMDWADRQVILEAGVTIDTAGRRITGVEPREVDQGQHDGDRDCLAVSSPGMLVRRDVWDEVGGFDTSMTLFREDVDLCWRVHAAGYRVRAITDAVIYHLEAAARHRRPVSVSRHPDRLDRRNALMTLLANLPARQMLTTLAGNAAVSALRTIFFLIAKRPTAALDELAAAVSVYGHPFRLLSARRRRARGRRAAYGRLRPDLPPGRSVRRMAEFAAVAMAKSGQDGTAGSHHASEDPSEDDSMLVDAGLTQRILTHPGVMLFTALTVISLIAGRSLLGSGTISGGALIPASGGVAGLWHLYVQGFHPTGIGSGTIAPPYLAIIAVLATILGGKPWLAVEVILLACVPLAGLTAYFATRRITRFAPARVWAAASYALLPVAMGSVAAGRVGTAMVFVLLPLVALAVGRMLTQPPKLARRAAWATGLGVAVCAAFVPVIWIIAGVAGILAAAVLARRGGGMLLNLAIAVLVTPVLLIPWTAQVFTHPALLLLEAGAPAPGLVTPDLPARSLLLLSPGGPGLPAFWITAGIVVAALAALLLSQRRGLIAAGWGMGLFGLLAAVAESRAVVTVPGAGVRLPAWPGSLVAVAAVGLVLAALAGGDSLPRLMEGGLRGSHGLRSVRGLGLAVVALVACSAPVLAAASWVTNGVSGPVASVRQHVVPELISVSSANGLRLRTLVLREAGGHVTYTLLRGTAPSIGEPDLAPDPAAARALSRAVATLVAPNGGDAADQGHFLAQFDIGFVLMPAPASPALARLLDGVAGLRPVSASSSFDLWRLLDTPARVRVVDPDGKITPLPSGPVNVKGAAAPAAGGILELAEPTGGWSATLNGRPLTAVPSPEGSWAQAFRLPAGGGQLSITHDNTVRGVTLLAELVLLLLVGTLALPGIGSAGAASAAGTRRADGTAPGGQAPGRKAAGGRRAAGGRPEQTVPIPAGAPAGTEVPVAPAALAAPGPRGRAAGRGKDKNRSAGPARRPKGGRKGAPAGRRAGRGAAAKSPAGPAAAAAGPGSAGGPGNISGPGAPGSPAQNAAPWDAAAQMSGQPPAPSPAGRPPGQSPAGQSPAGQPPGWPATPPAAAWPDSQPASSWPDDSQTAAWPAHQPAAHRPAAWDTTPPAAAPGYQPGYPAGQGTAHPQAGPADGRRPYPSPGPPARSAWDSAPPQGPPGRPAWDTPPPAAPPARPDWETTPPAGRPTAPHDRGMWESASSSGSHQAPPPDRGSWPGGRPPGRTLDPPAGHWASQPPAMAPSPSAWPSGGESLDPLPTGGGSSPAWPDPETEDEPPSRWPAASQETGDDRW